MPDRVDPRVEPAMIAEPIVEEISMGEENEQASTCRNCGGSVFMDFIEVDHTDENEEGRVYDETCFWQHNDERYTPGQPSPCGPSEKWESLRA